MKQTNNTYLKMDLHMCMWLHIYSMLLSLVHTGTAWFHDGLNEFQLGFYELKLTLSLRRNFAVNNFETSFAAD